MLPSSLPIWVAMGPVNLRWSFDRLIGIVRDNLGADPSCGLFVFLNRRATRAKVLFHDGTGWCQLYKRLDKGKFPLPITLENGTVRVRISPEELHLLLVGSQVRKVRTRRLMPAKPELTLH